MVNISIFIVVAVLFSVVYGQKVKGEKKCKTKAPPRRKCSTTLSVEHGTACYYDHDTAASVSCNERYSFNTDTVFKCESGRVWSPTATATCTSAGSLEEETTSAITITSSVSKTTSTLPQSAMAPTSTSYIPVSISVSTTILMASTSIFSTTPGIHPDVTESMFSTTFRSDLLPSETNTYLTSGISITPALSTDVLQSDTVRNEYSTSILSETSTLPTSLFSATSQPVPVLQNTKESGVRPVYIIVPVVVVIIASVLVNLFLLWRHRRRNVQSVLKKEKCTGTSAANKAYEGYDLDRQSSLINKENQRESRYAEISLDTLNADQAAENVYQTIDNLPDEHIISNKTYGHIKQQKAKCIDKNYSHIDTTIQMKSSLDDKTYNHTKAAVVSKESFGSLDNEDLTYNRLNTKQTWINRSEELDGNDDSELEYSHAKAGDHAPENRDDNYSHLNNSLQTLQTNKNNEKPQYIDKENGTKISEIPKTKIHEVQPYEFPKELESPLYEFAKDVKNSDSENVDTHYTANDLNPKYEELKRENIGNRVYETVDDKSNDYEPKEEHGRNDESVQALEVIEEGSTDIIEPTNHTYFILEKTET